VKHGKLLTGDEGEGAAGCRRELAGGNLQERTCRREFAGGKSEKKSKAALSSSSTE